MNIEAIIMGIALLMCGYMIGYYRGFKGCFEHLRAELEKFRKGEE